MAYNLSGVMETKEEFKIVMDGKLDGTKSKACLFNLIVYTHDIRCEKNFTPLVEMVAPQLPCRIIFIQANKNDHEMLVKFSTVPLKENKNVSCDKITIKTHTKDLDKVPFIIYPYIVPDVPVYLLWGTDPLREKIILPKLKNFVTRLIFDSECTDNLQEMSKDLLEQKSSWNFDVLDLNWARFGGWREVLSKTFDSEERFSQLKNASSFKIKYNDLHNEQFSNPDTQAIYLQGWLASQLGWTFVKMENNVIYYQGSQLVKVELIPDQDQKYSSEDILEFEVADQNNYQCTISRKGENHVVVHASNQFQCMVPFTLLLSSLKGRTFIQDVFYHRISPHYFSMLKMITKADWRHHG